MLSDPVPHPTAGAGEEGMGEGMSTDNIGVGGEDKRVNRLGNGAAILHDQQSSRLDDIRHQGASAISFRRVTDAAPQMYCDAFADAACCHYRQMRLSSTMSSNHCKVLRCIRPSHHISPPRCHSFFVLSSSPIRLSDLCWTCPIYSKARTQSGTCT